MLRFPLLACQLVALTLVGSSAVAATPRATKEVQALAGLGADGLFAVEPAERSSERDRAYVTRVARRRRSSCTRLRGRDLAPARRAKLVRRRNNDNGTDLLGCVLPRGRVYRVAASEDSGTSGSAYRLRQVAGATVLVESSAGSQYGAGKRTFVKSLRSGREYEVASSCSALVTGTCPRTKNTSAAAAFVNSRGQAAAAILPEGGATTTIAGFSPRGTRQDLDTGFSDQLPYSALRLSGSWATWVHGGKARSARLPR